MPFIDAHKMSENPDEEIIIYLREENIVTRRRIEVKEIKVKVLKEMIRNMKNKAGKREE